MNSEWEEHKAILRELEQAAALGSAPCVPYVCPSGTQRFAPPIYPSPVSPQEDRQQPELPLSPAKPSCVLQALPHQMYPAIPNRSLEVPKL